MRKKKTQQITQCLFLEAEHQLHFAGTTISVIDTYVPHAIDKKLWFLSTLLNPEKGVEVLIALSRDFENLTKLMCFIEATYSNLHL